MAKDHIDCTLEAEGIRVVVRGRPETDELIGMERLKRSPNQAAYDYTDRHFGPKEKVGNKGGTLGNKLRGLMAGKGIEKVARAPRQPRAPRGNGEDDAPPVQLPKKMSTAWFVKRLRVVEVVAGPFNSYREACSSTPDVPPGDGERFVVEGVIDNGSEVSGPGPGPSDAG